jgi:hypothetical protein
MTNILSFDPGDTTGWCYQNEDETKDFGNAVGLKEVIDVCKKYEGKVDHVVIEDYVILQKKASSHSGSRVPAIQIIGYLKGWAIGEGVDVTLYPARLKPIQQRMTQMVPRGAHKNTHWVDAFNHGRYYLIKEHGADTALMKEMKEKKNG